MRLLKYARVSPSSGTHIFSLIKCDPLYAPQYAILSHRWGADDDEATFQDIEQGTVEKRVGGYKKLEFCAQQAERDHLEYFWVDTCCIDKSNNTELSQAIHSMYKWHEQATKCYVYLPDVSAEQEWEADFHESEWFKRGWTLQELIAPRVVEFFSVDGRKLGDKQSLEQRIQQISGISIEVLQGKSLTEVSEYERFSWTIGRQTIVDEDTVYCLLSLFGVLCLSFTVRDSTRHEYGCGERYSYRLSPSWSRRSLTGVALPILPTNRPISCHADRPVPVAGFWLTLSTCNGASGPIADYCARVFLAQAKA